MYSLRDVILWFIVLMGLWNSFLLLCAAYYLCSIESLRDSYPLGAVITLVNTGFLQIATWVYSFSYIRKIENKRRDEFTGFAVLVIGLLIISTIPQIILFTYLTPFGIFVSCGLSLITFILGLPIYLGMMIECDQCPI